MALNSFIVELNLDVEWNNELVHLICEQVVAAEKGAFAQGIEIGVKFKEWEWALKQDVASSADRGGGLS